MNENSKKKLKSKICGITDIKTLKYLINHPYSPQFIGFIVNYKKSKRYLNYKKLVKLLNVKKKKIKFVAVLVKPNIIDLENIKRLPFDYYQIYDASPKKIRLISCQKARGIPALHLLGKQPARLRSLPAELPSAFP